MSAATTAVLTFEAASGCYTGPFPHNNTAQHPLHLVGNTSFSGNVSNSGTVVASGIIVTNSTITARSSTAA